MTSPSQTPTHAELAKGIGVSRSYVSRLSRLGMPTDSVKSAMAWIKKRSKGLGTDRGSQQSLTEARREKLRLECEILTMRLERERDDIELVPVTEAGKFLNYFLTFAGVAFTAQSESLTNELCGKPEIEVYRQLREAFSKTLFIGALGYIKGGGESPDRRLVAHAEKFITEHFSHFPAQAKADIEQNLIAMIQEAKP